MTDRYERIRKALAKWPTQGPWGATHGDAYLIAACDPDTIRALLEERDALRAELDESCAVVDKLARLLEETAIVIKGPEPDMTKWSYHDIPDGVRAIQARAERLAESLAGLITWIPSVDTYRRLGFDPATPMQVLEEARALLRDQEEGK